MSLIRDRCVEWGAERASNLGAASGDFRERGQVQRIVGVALSCEHEARLTFSTPLIGSTSPADNRRSRSIFLK